MMLRERFLAALDRKTVNRVSFVETSVATGVSEKLVGRSLTRLNSNGER